VIAVTTVIAVIGVQALYLLFAWLLSAIVASYLSGRKGYGERPGLASGMIIPVISVLVWLVMPAKEESDWKVIGPFGRQSPTDAPVVAPGADGDERPAGPAQA
jgi:hypothetical protein